LQLCKEISKPRRNGLKPSREVERTGKTDWGWRESGGVWGGEPGAGRVRPRKKRNQN